MKYKIYITLLVCTFSNILISQTASVEKSTFGVQAGFLGIYLHNEMKLTNQIALRTEIGMIAGVFYFDSPYSNSGLSLSPVITVEPRWYYNLDKRQLQGKSISGNSGNFLTVQTNYYPDWFVGSKSNFISTNSISFIPTWGIKRNIGKHFTYEAAAGIGSDFELERNTVDDGFSPAFNLHLRVGYRF